MTPTSSIADPAGTPDSLPRVLIVDDREENLLALGAVLESLDVQIVRAGSGAEAVARCSEQEFAVVVLDVMMPGIDGLETARRLKARGASRLTPIIFLTAVEADRRRVHDGYASGAVDYLFKPVDPDLLRDKVAAFVELFRNRRADQWRQRRRYADQVAAAAEAAFRDGDERFLLLAESVPAMVWTASAHGRVEFMNAYGAAYVGVPLDEVKDLRWSTHVHPDDVSATRERWRRAIRSGEPYEAEVRIWSAERAAWRRHLSRAVARRDASGAVIGWVGVNTDVEDSIRAEEEMHALQLTAEREARIASDDARVELGRAVDRFERLQSLTTALSQAATPEEVAQVVVMNGVAALGAAAGVVTKLVDASGERPPTLHVVRATGYDPAVVAAWREIPLDAPVPLAESARTQVPFLVTRDQLRERYRGVATESVQYAAAYSLPLIAQGTVIGAMGLSFASPPELSDEDRALADAIARQCAQALHRAELFDAERRARHEAETARQRVTFLSDSGAALNESLDYQETLQALADAAVPFLADYALVDMIGADGVMQRMAYATADPSKRELIEASFAHVGAPRDVDHPLNAAVQDGESRLLADVDDAAFRKLARNPEHLEIVRAVGAASVMIVPLRARTRTLGVVTMARWDAGRRYTPQDLRLAEELGRRAAIAIDTARLYEAAQEANAAKASFLAAVSHDLRQPLNASLGFLDIALMGLRGEVASNLREDLERVRRNQQHLLALINDVLSFARVEAGQLIVRREFVSLSQVFDTLPSLVSPQADAKRVSLTIGQCSPLLGVLGDRDRVVQVLTNLLTNAIKATPQGGSVGVDCEPVGDVVLTRVRDTGVGIAAAMVDRIFEPFVQVTRSLNRPEEGIGLGLSISRNLARAMGGELTVESSVGTGSVFTLRLPRAPVMTPVFPMSHVPAQVEERLP